MSLQSAIRRPLCVVVALAAFSMPGSLNPRIVAWGDAAQSASPSFAGKFGNEKFTLELSESAGGYAGTITQGENHFPAKATANGEGLSGTFTAEGAEFQFTATIRDGQLVFVTGGKTQLLARAVRNPLNPDNVPAPVVPAPRQPEVAVADPGIFDDSPTLGGFTVLGSTPRGKTLFIKLAAAQTLESAMTQTADELGKVLDAKPEVTGAFANGKEMNKGGVTLTGKLKGHAMQGVIFCGIDAKGGTATVILATADATKDDLNTLQGAMPVPALKMVTQRYPDGSGSVDLPDGWTTPNASAAHGVGVGGPAGQVVLFGVNIAVKLPDCPMVKQMDEMYPRALSMYRMQMQSYQQNVEARKRFPNILALPEPQAPVPPDPDPNVRFPAWIFCRQCDGPEEVLKYWFPVREKNQRRTGKAYTTLDKVIEVIPLPPNPLMAGSKAGVAYVAMTDHDGDKVTHVRAVMQICTAPILQGDSWQLSMCIMRAPDETFDKDLPVMTAIMNSVNLNQQVIDKETWAETNSALEWGRQMHEQLLKRGREFQEEQATRFNNFERQMAAQQQARHDSASDFIEYIGGVRAVYNTQTGQMINVNLFNSNAITNGLNAAANNPAQWVQVPLRYLR